MKNGKQTRGKTVSLNMYEAICLKRAAEEFIERVEVKAEEGPAIIPRDAAIGYLETTVDKLNRLPYFEGATQIAKPKMRSAEETVS